MDNYFFNHRSNAFANHNVYVNITGKDLLERMMEVRDLEDPPSMEEEFPSCKGFLTEEISFQELMFQCEIYLFSVCPVQFVQVVENVIEGRLHHQWMKEQE